MKTTCKKSWPVNFCRTSCGFSILLTTEVVPKIFPNLNVVGHLVVPAGWGSCMLRLAIFVHVLTIYFYCVNTSYPMDNC